ncbi:MAG: AMP-binding protein [Rhodobacteraceae bacterium]|nr:AMP-binding protein [Paracoccaceae bacterium]
MGKLAPINGMSHVKGSTDDPLIDATIPQLVSQISAQHSSETAVVFHEQGIRRSYAAFTQDIDALAHGLLDLGLVKGDRVGIWSPNRYEWVLTQFATARLGLVLVNINPAYRLNELEYALNKVECRALVTAQRFKSSDYLGMIQTLAPEITTAHPGAWQAARLPHLQMVIAMGETDIAGAIPFDSLMTNAADTDALDAITDTLHPDDAINIQFTSGTTGRPKGATLTHRNIVNNAGFVTDRIKLGTGEGLCIPVPLYHCFGMVMGVLGALTKGATMVFPGEAFEPAATLETLEQENCVALYGVPTMFLAMLQDLDSTGRDLSALRTGIMAGALCPMEVMRAVQDKMGMHELTICYGMTETAPVSFQSFTDDPVNKRCETVGRVHPHLEVKIVDPDGNTVPVGATGELCTKGYSVMQGYWGDAEKTADSIRDGWMMTGDLAFFDEEGYCTINGRAKDMIIRGGENIYPREIEDFLMSHAEISDAQVFGLPDERFGEIVCAWVIPAAGHDLSEDQIKAMCKDQIAHFKMPAHVRIVTEFPMTVTGKPQKFVMRDEMLAAKA